ncbi:MAG: acyl-CoA-binding protein [Pseudomonadota bacterium]
MSIQEDFSAAVEFVTGSNSSVNLSNAEKLRFYALYKQATEGDVKGKQPSFINVVGRAKFDAWEKLKGTSQEQAKQEYVNAIKPFIN